MKKEQSIKTIRIPGLTERSSAYLHFGIHKTKGEYDILSFSKYSQLKSGKQIIEGQVDVCSNKKPGLLSQRVRHEIEINVRKIKRTDGYYDFDIEVDVLDLRLEHITLPENVNQNVNYSRDTYNLKIDM